MAKKSASDIELSDVLTTLNKKYSTPSETEFVKTNLLSVDIVLGGKGIPLGKTIDICSESGVGKSTLLLHIANNLCDQGYKCLWLDSECALDDELINGIANVNKNNASLSDEERIGPLMRHKEDGDFIVFGEGSCSSFSAVEDILDRIIPTEKVRFIFIDSLTNITSESRLLSTAYDKDAVSIDKVQVASDARAQSSFMKKYKAMAKRHNVTLFFVSQQRTYINMGYGGKPSGATRAGGKAIKYNLDCMIDLINAGKIKRVEKTINGEEEIDVGRNIILYISEKCRFAPGNVKVPGAIYFGQGFSNVTTLRRFMEIKMVKDGNKERPMLSNSGRSYTIILGDEKVKLDGKENVKNYISDNYDKILTFFDSSDFALIKNDFQDVVGDSTPDNFNENYEQEFEQDEDYDLDSIDESEDIDE